MLAPILLLAAALAGPPSRGPSRHLKVVASLTTYGAIAREIVGDRASVTSIAKGDEDQLRSAEAQLRLPPRCRPVRHHRTGSQLWVPALLDRAGNRKIQEGGPGTRRRLPGITLLECPRR